MVFFSFNQKSSGTCLEGQEATTPTAVVYGGCCQAFQNISVFEHPMFTDATNDSILKEAEVRQ